MTAVFSAATDCFTAILACNAGTDRRTPQRTCPRRAPSLACEVRQVRRQRRAPWRTEASALPAAVSALGLPRRKCKGKLLAMALDGLLDNLGNFWVVVGKVLHDLVDVVAGIDHGASAHSRRQIRRCERRWLCERRDDGASSGQALHCLGRSEPRDRRCPWRGRGHTSYAHRRGSGPCSLCRGAPREPRTKRPVSHRSAADRRSAAPCAGNRGGSFQRGFGAVLYGAL